MLANEQMTYPLKIAYVFQSISTNFSEPFAVQLHIYHQIRGLQQAGHNANLLALQGRRVLYTRDLQVFRTDKVLNSHFGKLGFSGAASFKLFESGVRRIQTGLRLPYLALFDSYRNYDACCQNLQGYDLIHERYNLLSLGGALASRGLAIPYVLEVNADLLEERQTQGTPEHGLRRLFALWTTRFCFDTAHCIICVSTQLKNHLVKKWKVDSSKIVVLPNAADTEAFGRRGDVESTKRRLGLTTEPIIMFVGGFYLWHDLPLLVKSFAKVLPKIPDAKLVLVGDGRTRSMIEQTVVDVGLQHAVIMAGTVEHHCLPEMLAIADVAVAPNISFFAGHGGSPLKIFEYMAAGKAIVATKTGQVAEVIQDGHNGLLVESGNMAELTQAVLRLLQDKAERTRLGQNARSQAVAKHSWEQYIKQLEEIYFRVI